MRWSHFAELTLSFPPPPHLYSFNLARRKSKFLEDDSDSDDSGRGQDDLDDQFDPDDPDTAAERELFRNPYGRGKKRNREDIVEDNTYGVWAEQADRSSSGRGGARAGKTTDYTRCVIKGFGVAEGKQSLTKLSGAAEGKLSSQPEGSRPRRRQLLSTTSRALSRSL